MQVEECGLLDICIYIMTIVIKIKYIYVNVMKF